MKNNKGFTLVEILVVIVILSILIVIAIPIVNNQIEKSKKSSFFVSVSNIVDSINIENVMNETDFCMYSYADDKEVQNDLIENMYVLVHKENNKLIYTVYAKAKNAAYVIDSYDFSKLNASDETAWKEKIQKGKSYTYFASKLSGIFDTSEDSEFQNLKNYKICE